MKPRKSRSIKYAEYLKEKYKAFPEAVQALDEFIEYEFIYAEKPSDSLIVMFRQTFDDVYMENQEQKGVVHVAPFYFSPKELKGLKQIADQIKFVSTAEKISDDNLNNTFRIFLTLLPEWWKANSFSPSSISNNFNKLWNQVLIDDAERRRKTDKNLKNADGRSGFDWEEFRNL